MSINVDQYVDLVFFLNTPTDSRYFSLIENWNVALPINITCSIYGGIPLQHTIENYGNNLAPTWVTLDDANNQLILSIPEVNANTDYYFRIRTIVVGSSTNYYMLVNLTVLN